MQLREYQQRALTMLYDWFEKNKSGNPVLNMPGGSGKSVVIATLAKDALQSWPETRILMVVHSQELVSQNAEKLRKIWRNAPLGVYSAGLNRRDLGEPITFASIQSVRNRASQIGHVDLAIIDEVHAVSAKESGTYRAFLKDLQQINPEIRLVGFTASPYRLGHGMITDGEDAIFSEIIEPVTILDLVDQGFLCHLRSKVTSAKLSTKGLHTRQGEYVAKEMQEAFNTTDKNESVVSEVISVASDRKHWLFFCSGVQHCIDVVAELERNGISATYVEANLSKSDRDKRIADFQSGKIRAMCNVGILTTGWDFPALDCIAFLRATQSPGLYLQMAVRGMRIAPGKVDCLVLDFAGNVRLHGPITEVRPPTKTGGEGDGEPPVKACEVCGELVNISVKVCPACFTPFPVTEKAPLKLHHDDIMGIQGNDLAVKDWEWRVHTSRSSGNDMLRVTYYGAKLSDPNVDEYLPVCNIGYAGEKAIRTLAAMAHSSGAHMPDKTIQADDYGWMESVANVMRNAIPPSVIEYKMDGKFFRVIRRDWSNADQSTN